MPLHIENRGKGFIGELGSGWRISQNGSPVILGQAPGRLGSLSFSAACDSTSKFTIDNYLSVQHLYDDQVNRWLTTFDGNIRSVEVPHAATGERYGTLTMASILSALDVERTSSVDVAGTFQRSMELPVVDYTVDGVGYTTGGYWTSVGSENVFVPRPILIWDVTSENNYIYVLASGGHNGEVVFQIGIDGIFRSMWPVYSDATDLAGPDSRFVSYADGFVYVGQSGAKRIKKFVSDGTYVTQWGSSGSADGQFNTISGLAVNGTAMNAVYVTDSILGRVQCFTETGTFLFKWGTLGTGAGDLVFNAPNYISIDAVTNNVFISDRNARVREYTSGGGYVSQPMGSYNFTSSTSTGEFVAGGYPIKTDFDHLGNAYAIQLGKIFKYARTNGGWVTSSGKPIKEWQTQLTTQASPPTTFTITPSSGIMHVAQVNNVVEQYAASLGKIKSYMLYYIALAKPNFPARIMTLNDGWSVGELAYIAWTGNVWDHLCQMCAATSNAMALFDDRLLIFDRESRGFTLPNDVQVGTLRIDSRAAGQAIEIVNQNSRYTVGQEVLYSAQADNQRTFSVAVNSLNYVTVSQNAYPEFVNDPTPHTVTADGRYTVIDSGGLLVTPSLWTNYGASVRADLGDRPGSIVLTITGPGEEIPGYQSPFKIASISGQPSLSVTGAGVVANPELITIGTGVSEEISNRRVAQTIDSPFAYNAEVAYNEGTWAAYNSGTPNQRITFTMRADKSPLWINDSTGVGGTMQFINSIIQYEDAQYIVEDLDYTNNQITLSCYRYTMTSWSPGGDAAQPRFEEIWAGRTAYEFDAYWSEYTAEDFTIAPLRNPFGV